MPSNKITIFFFCLVLCSSCSEYREQKNKGSTHDTDEFRLASMGIALTQQNTSLFLKNSLSLQTNIESSSSRLEQDPLAISDDGDLVSSFKKTVQSFYSLREMALGEMQATDTIDPLANIYYSSLNRCLVDLLVLNLRDKEPLPEQLHPSLKGLAALDYLLFEPSLQSSCNLKKYPQLASWNDLPPLEKKKNRYLLAKELNKQIVSFAKTMQEKWNDQSPQYSLTMQSIEITKSDTLAVKNIVQALASLEKIKDQDLGSALGLNTSCSSLTGKCPENTPFPYSGASLNGILGSLKTWQMFLNGPIQSDNLTLSSYLSLKDQGSLAENFNKVVTEAIATAEQIDKDNVSLQTLIDKMDSESCRQTTLEQPKVPICFLYRQIENLTNLYKSDLLTFMSLKINHSLPQGDND